MEQPVSDEVPVLEPWHPTRTATKINATMLKALFDAMEQPLEDGSRWTLAPNSSHRVGKLVEQHLNVPTREANLLVERWKAAGAISQGMFKHPKRHKPQTCVEVDKAKLAKLMMEAARLATAIASCACKRRSCC